MASDIIMSALLNRIQNAPIITVDYDTSRKRHFLHPLLFLKVEREKILSLDLYDHHAFLLQKLCGRTESRK